MKLDELDAGDAAAALARCCGARRWIEGMLARRPFGPLESLLRAADEVWAQMSRADVLEAFAHHPEIGGDLEALRERFPSTASLSAAEQAGAAAAAEPVLVALRDANQRYRKRFGYIFIVCATGKSAREMLEIVHARLNHDPEIELGIAAAEQAAITRLRLMAFA